MAADGKSAKEIIAEVLKDRNAAPGSRVEPDWDSTHVSTVTTPWGKTTVEATFSDPMLAGWRVLVVEDTLPPDYVDDAAYEAAGGVVPERITTMVMRFPRCILPEFNTHRVFSRNSASSRARSFKTTIQPVMEDPYIPLFTVNQKGMGGRFATSDVYMESVRAWLEARNRAVYSTLEMLLGEREMVDAGNVIGGEPVRLSPEHMPAHWEELTDRYVEDYREGNPAGYPSVHKQNANRLMEPFMWHEALCTSTYWKNFLELRISEYAQPEIKALAILVREALKASKPERSVLHLPFISKGTMDFEDQAVMEEIMLLSASECARISYKDRSTMTNRENSGLGRKLLEQKHMSPFEHVAVANCTEALQFKGFQGMMDAIRGRDLSSNLSPSWIQYRRIVSAREQ